MTREIGVDVTLSPDKSKAGANEVRKSLALIRKEEEALARESRKSQGQIQRDLKETKQGVDRVGKSVNAASSSFSSMARKAVALVSVGATIRSVVGNTLD